MSFSQGFQELFTRRRKIGRHTNFTLTPAGKQKAEGYGNQPGDRILSALDEIRTGNTDEIADEAKMGRGAVEKYMPMLIKSGYVQVIRSEE